MINQGPGWKSKSLGENEPGKERGDGEGALEKKAMVVR